MNSNVSRTVLGATVLPLLAGTLLGASAARSPSAVFTLAISPSGSPLADFRHLLLLQPSGVRNAPECATGAIPPNLPPQ